MPGAAPTVALVPSAQVIFTVPSAWVTAVQLSPFSMVAVEPFPQLTVVPVLD